MSVKITQIHLSADGTDHEHITDLTWVCNQDGSTESGSRAALVAWIGNKGDAFVETPNGRVRVGIVEPVGLQPYLRTFANDEWTDALLTLPRF